MRRRPDLRAELGAAEQTTRSRRQPARVSAAILIPICPPCGGVGTDVYLPGRPARFRRHSFRPAGTDTAAISRERTVCILPLLFRPSVSVIPYGRMSNEIYLSAAGELRPAGRALGSQNETGKKYKSRLNWTRPRSLLSIDCCCNQRTGASRSAGRPAERVSEPICCAACKSNWYRSDWISLRAGRLTSKRAGQRANE